MYSDVESVKRWARDLYAHLRSGPADSGYIARHCDMLLSDLSELFRLEPGPPMTDVVFEEARQMIACSEAAERLESVDAPALQAAEQTWWGEPSLLAAAIDDWPQLIVAAGRALGELSHASLAAIRRCNEAAEAMRLDRRVEREEVMRAPAAMIGSIRQSAILLVGEGCLEPLEAEMIEELMEDARLRLDRFFGYPELLSARPVHSAFGRSLMRVFEFAGFRPRKSPFTRERGACYCVAIAASQGLAVSPATLRSNPVRVAS